MQLKILSVVGIILAYFCTNFVTAGLSDEVEKLLEEFRIRMCHPFPKLGIPVLDPFEISNKKVDMDSNIFKNFSASVTDLKVTGLSDFIINKIKISTLTQKFTFDLTFSLDDVQSDYTAKGSIADVVNLVGDDRLKGHLKDFHIVVTGGIKIGMSFGIKNLKITLSIGEMAIDFGKLLEHDRLNNFFHNLLNDLTIELLGDFWEDYGDSLTKKVENIINKKMSGYTLKEIIGIISGSGKPIFGDNPPGDCKPKIGIEPRVILHL